MINHKIHILLCAGMIWLKALPVSAEPHTAFHQADRLSGIIQHNNYSQTGTPSNVGLIHENGDMTLSGAGIDPQGSFRIGSQSKMFTGSVILRMIDQGYFALNDTIGSLQQKYGVDLGVSQLPPGTENITVKELLNMSSRIPNYMGGTRPGASSTLWNEWIAAKYGAITPPVNHADLAGLGLSGYPQAPSPPYQGTYSNTNAIILSLIGERAYAARTGTAKPFDEILNEMVLGPAGLEHTYLATTANARGIIPGKESGETITEADTTIPWTSGAVVSTLEDQLKWLRILKTNTLPDGSSFLSDKLFHARTSANNSTLISMGGMPLHYGYNIFNLNFTDSNVPLTLLGHGGSIAGYSSFSAWYQQLNVGIVVNVPSLSTIDKHGVYTATPSEALLMELSRGLERLFRADGILHGLERVSPGAHGGYVTFQPIITDAAQNNTFVVEASGRHTSFLDLTFMRIGANPIRTTLDPTLTYYSDTIGSAAVFLRNGVSGHVSQDARAEAYGNRVAVFQVEKGATLKLEGETAAYGEAASAIRVGVGGNLYTAADSLAYLQGGGGSTLDIAPGAGEVRIAGSLATLGSSSALHLNGSTATVEATGSLTALTAAYSMAPDFTTRSPDTNAVYGATLENGAVLHLYGTVSAQAAFPWNGSAYASGLYVSDPYLMPGTLAVGLCLNNATANIYGMVASSGYGVWMKDGSNRLYIAGGAVNGNLLAIRGESGDDTVLLENGALILGNIDLGKGYNSLQVHDSTLVLHLTDYPSILGADKLVFGHGTRITGMSGVFGDSSYLLATDVGSYSAVPLIQDPAKPVSFSLAENNGNVILNSHRDWHYYATHTANRNLGETLDSMAVAAVNGRLSHGGYAMVESLDASSDPGRNALTLQPLSPTALVMAQIRQAPVLHQTIATEQIPSHDKNWFAFGAFYGHSGWQDGSGQAFDGYDLEGSGAIAGFGRNLDATKQSGIFFQYGSEETDSRTTGKAEDRTMRLGPFVRWSSSGTQWSTALSTAFHKVELARAVSFLDEQNQADFDMQDVMLSSSLSHTFNVNAFNLVPYLDAVYQHLWSDGYTEKGGISALTLDSMHGNLLATAAGLEASRDFNLSGVTIIPRLGLGWWRHWLDQPETDAAFQSNSSFRFSSTGVDLDSNLIRLHASLDLVTTGGWRFNLAYNRYEGSSLDDTNILGLTIGGIF